VLSRFSGLVAETPDEEDGGGWSAGSGGGRAEACRKLESVALGTICVLSDFHSSSGIVGSCARVFACACLRGVGTGGGGASLLRRFTGCFGEARFLATGFLT